MPGTTVSEPVARRRPHRGRRTTVALLVAGVIAGAVAGASWWRSPMAFSEMGWGSSFVMAPQPLEAFPGLFTVGNLAEGSETVTLREVRPRWDAQGADVGIEFFVCSGVGSGGWFGPITGDEAGQGPCDDLRPVRDGTPMRLDPDGGDLLVYRVTPAREGTSRLDWIEVEYTRGPAHLWQTGTQRIVERSTIDVG